MRKKKLSFSALALFAAALLFGSMGPATAAVLELSHSTTFDGTAVVTTPPVGTGAQTVLPNPTAIAFANSYSAATVGIPGTGYGFYDDYIFSIPTEAKVSSVATTLGFGGTFNISDLQERLFKFDGNALPVLGTPVGGSTDSFGLPIGLQGALSILPNTILAAGTYVLQIRGNVTGSAGGSYAGMLSLVPVPLPAALPMLLAGLAVLGGVARRRAKMQNNASAA
jgi:hypothetical protein